VPKEVPLNQKIADFMYNIMRKNRFSEEDKNTVEEMVNNRDNFSMGVCGKLCSCGDKRKVKIFNKGRRKITEDLDVRTYIKSVRNLKIMQNVLLTEHQRALMNY
jgi:hypothetical protein